MTTLRTFAARKAGVRTATIQQKAQKRLQVRADNLTKMGRAKAGAELLNETMMHFIELLYAFDRDARALANVDSYDGSLLLPVPWGRRHRSYGLKAPEAEVLRRHMLTLDRLSKKNANTAPALMRWDEDARRWFVNMGDYPSLAEALGYWRGHEVTAVFYHRAMQEIKRRWAQSRMKF